ncbi:MAG: insulinase family protein [Lachnospiraceae bacterium]|nr:insulinase family protein [Lachnospiraceae bacterium]
MKKTVRIIAMLTASVLIFGECVTEVYAKSGVAAGEKKTYTAGEKTGGFTVSDTYDFESFDAKVSLFSHTQSGAKVVLIQNDDPNRFFMLEFDTKAENNKGTAHVLEHSIMSGSAKYPSRSLAGALSSRAYLTYMNAFTKNASTSFPVASLSEKQLLKMAQYYTDLCFDPMILRDEDIFSSEAWRFTVDDTTGELGVNGTIYSEMSGRYSSDMAAMAKAAGLLYPGCPSSYIAGGIPQDILTLSYEEVKDFYKKYYKPSECTAYLYGDIKDAKAFLDLLDERFSGYEAPQKDSTDIAGGKALAASSEKEDTGARCMSRKNMIFLPRQVRYTQAIWYMRQISGRCRTISLPGCMLSRAVSGGTIQHRYLSSVRSFPEHLLTLLSFRMEAISCLRSAHTGWTKIMHRNSALRFLAF